MAKPLALVIEDNQDQAFVFQSAMEGAGFETEIVMDGADAQKRLREIVPNIIILDLHLPSISGKALLNQIRADKRMVHTTVFLATADAALANQLRTDTNVVLLKPISFAHLTTLAKRYSPPKSP